MRRLLLTLFVLALLPAAADAQRRYRVVHDDEERGTDLQVLGTGLNVDGVGLRFWMTSRTALATRFDFDYIDFEGAADAEQLNLGVGLNVERHAGYGRVHPFLTLGGSVGVLTITDEDAPGDDTRTRTLLGGEIGLGAEARLFSGLSLSALYALRADFTTGDDASEIGGVVPEDDMDPLGTADTRVRLGGRPRLALSFRF